MDRNETDSPHPEASSEALEQTVPPAPGQAAVDQPAGTPVIEPTAVRPPISQAPSPAGDPPSGHVGAWGAGGLLMLMNGVIGGISAVYVTTGSLAVTLLAGCVALILAVLIIWKK
jgi:hypothetical protein